MTEHQTVDEDALDLVLELAHCLVPFTLTPSEETIVEDSVSGAVRGDIASGELMPVQIVRKRLDHSGVRQWPANEIDVTYFRRSTKEWGQARIEILSSSDITFLAQAFRWLLDHDPKENKDGT